MISGQAQDFSPSEAVVGLVSSDQDWCELADRVVVRIGGRTARCESVSQARRWGHSGAVDLILIDPARELASIARFLVELSRSPVAPVVLLAGQPEEVGWLSMRLGLLHASLGEDDLEVAVRRSLREKRRPGAPS